MSLHMQSAKIWFGNSKQVMDKIEQTQMDNIRKAAVRSSYHIYLLLSKILNICRDFRVYSFFSEARISNCVLAESSSLIRR